MTAKQKWIECLSGAAENLSVEEAIHRLVLRHTLEIADADPDEMDHEDFVKELAAEGAFDEGPVEKTGST